MPNITKYLITIFLGIIAVNSASQEVIQVPVQLNDGGVVYDVAHDKYNDLYIVVGDFTSVNGIPRNNYVLLNEDDFSVNTSDYFDMITSINGPIYSVEFSSQVTGGGFGGHYYYYYFSGDFTEVNGESRNSVVKFQYFDYGFYSPVDSDVLINTFNPDFSDPLLIGAGFNVFDMQVMGDTIVMGGGFGYVNEGDPDEIYESLVGYRVSTNTLITGYPELGLDFGDVVTELNVMGDDLYVSTIPDDWYFDEGGYTYPDYGSGGLYKVLSGGGEDLIFSAGLLDCYDAQYHAREIDVEKAVILLDNCGGSVGSYMGVRDLLTGAADDLHSFSYPDEFPSVGNRGLETYKNYVLSAKSNSKLISAITENAPGDNPSIQWTVPIDNGAPGDDMDYQLLQKSMMVENNVLFFSTTDLETADGLTRTGLALICMEPHDIDVFTEFDTTICQQDTLTYSVSQSDFADGYIWEYTGTGMNIGLFGPGEFLTDTVYNHDGPAWTREITFNPWFTPGELRVTPFSTCNGTIEDGVLLTANTISIHIQTNPLPNAVAGPDTAITCAVDTLLLIGHSDTADVTYSWNELDGDIFGEHPYQDTLVFEPNQYILTVVDPLGCLNSDTVEVFMDTLRPTFDPVEGPFDLTCSDTLRTYLGFCNNLSDTTSFWRQLSTGDTLSNPAAVTLLGQYQFYTVNNENGCIDSLEMPILVYLNQPSPNIKIVGYDDIPVDEPLDTIDCYNPVLTLECYSDTAATVLNWVEADSTDPLGDIREIETGGNYYIHAENTENGCMNYVGLNIAEDFSVPNVILPEVTALNCSNDSLVLDGGTIFLDTILEWTGDGIDPSSNPLTIYDPGYYYLTVTKNDNGCSATDSLEIISDNSIDVFADDDTIACRDQLVVLSVLYGADIDEISYLWNNGDTESTGIYTAGVDSLAIVEVFGADDCYGLDSVKIDVPPIPVIEFEAFQPCGEGATGSIIASPVSGFAPFEYSIDAGISFQESPALTGLDYGTYTILVKDSLECLYEYAATIDESSDLPTPEFLFSTYNFQMDTVIVVDVSNPPTDSVEWIFSEELMHVGDLDGQPLVLLPDTGSFSITMNAWYGTCLVPLTKEIFVTEFDSTFATFANQNGIESFDLYPNPTTGTFTLEVHFYKKQRARIGIQDMLGYVYEERTFEEVDTITEEFELGMEAIDGTYVLHIISEFDSAYITFILSR